MKIKMKDGQTIDSGANTPSEPGIESGKNSGRPLNDFVLGNASNEKLRPTAPRKEFDPTVVIPQPNLASGETLINTPQNVML